jgi:hypothetical protein
VRPHRQEWVAEHDATFDGSVSRSAGRRPVVLRPDRDHGNLAWGVLCRGHDKAAAVAGDPDLRLSRRPAQRRTEAQPADFPNPACVDQGQAAGRVVGTKAASRRAGTGHPNDGVPAAGASGIAQG